MELIVQVPDEYFTNPNQMVLLNAVYEAMDALPKEYRAIVHFHVKAEYESDVESEVAYALDHTQFVALENFTIVGVERVQG